MGEGGGGEGGREREGGGGGGVGKGARVCQKNLLKDIQIKEEKIKHWFSLHNLNTPLYHRAVNHPTPLSEKEEKKSKHDTREQKQEPDPGLKDKRN